MRKFLDSLLCRKRRREPDPEENFIHMKRRKISEMPSTPIQRIPKSTSLNTRLAYFHTQLPNRQTNLYNITDPYDLYKQVVLPEDEQNQERLALKYMLFKEATEIAESSLKQMQPKEESKSFASRYNSVLNAIQNLRPSRAELPYMTNGSTEDFHSQNGRVPTLTSEQNDIIDDLLNSDKTAQVLIRINNIPITYQTIKRLRPNTWINDEIVNAFITLLPIPENVRIMNTFFFEIIMRMYNEKEFSLKRIEKMLKRKNVIFIQMADVTAPSRIILPINMNQAHWVCVVVNNEEREIQYYDSLSDSYAGFCTNVVLSLLEAVLQRDLDYNTVVMDCPKQQNVHDCGLFMLKTIECIALGEPLAYSQEDIPLLRRLMVLQLKEGCYKLDQQQ